MHESRKPKAIAMWFDFLFCSALLVSILYLPGFFLCRALRLDGPFALACAPVPSVAVYAILSVIYGVLGIKCSWANLLIPTLIVFFAIWLVIALRDRGAFSGGSDKSTADKRIWWIVALYLFAGLVVCAYVFVKSLDGAASFHPKHDNMTHYNNIRSFVDSGIWSSLTVNNFMGTGLDSASWQHVAFYPSAWHDLAAILISALGCEVAVAANAVNAVVAGVICPLSTFAFLRALFPNQKLVLASGAFVAVAFTAFPWAFLIKGPLYPNMLANALLPAVLAAVVLLVRGQFDSFRRRVVFGLAFGLASFIALALSQTNNLFTVLVFLAFFGATPLREAVSSKLSAKLRHSRRFTTLFYVAYIALVIVIWAAATSLPFLQGIIAYDNVGDASLGVSSSAFSTLSLSFFASLPQWALLIACLVGAVILVARRRSWLVALAAFMMFAYFISRFMLGYPKAFITGVWYNDPWRLAACASQFLVPLASAGLASAIALVARLLENPKDADGKSIPSARCLIVSAVSVLLVFSCWTFFPNYNEPRRSGGSHQTAYGQLRNWLKDSYDMGTEQVYSAEEQQFVDKVLETIPEGAAVINQPNDGSVFAYGLDGLNTYYRSNSVSGLTKNSEIIRKEIDEIAESESVQNAVKAVGAQYVLLLDQGVPWEDGVWMSEYHEGAVQNWDGLNGITDDTPGLEVVLADGDMRLYKIVD